MGFIRCDGEISNWQLTGTYCDISDALFCTVLFTVPGVAEGDMRIKSKGWSEVKTKFPGVAGWEALNQGQKQQSH